MDMGTERDYVGEVFSPGVPGMWIIDIFIQKTQLKFHFLMELSCLSSLSSGLQTYIPNCLGTHYLCTFWNPNFISTTHLPNNLAPLQCSPSLGRKTPLPGYTSQHLGVNVDTSLSWILP